MGQAAILFSSWPQPLARLFPVFGGAWAPSARRHALTRPKQARTHYTCTRAYVPARVHNEHDNDNDNGEDMLAAQRPCSQCGRGTGDALKRGGPSWCHSRGWRLRTRRTDAPGWLRRSAFVGKARPPVDGSCPINGLAGTEPQTRAACHFNSMSAPLGAAACYI